MSHQNELYVVCVRERGGERAGGGEREGENEQGLNVRNGDRNTNIIKPHQRPSTRLNG